MKQTYRCPILKKQHLTDKTVSFELDATAIAEPILPGQFFHILCGGPDSFLRRPVSVCDVEPIGAAGTGGKTLRLVFEIRGKGTQALAAHKPGDTLDLLGPLGRGFHIPPSGVRAAIVGGGIGVFPLLYLAKSLPFPCDVYLGFRSSGQILLAEEFTSLSHVRLVLCTDNGSCGYCGFAPAALAEALDGGARYDIVYTCGPRAMMDCVAKAATEKNIPCQLSLEERMGCGIGACLVCACKTRGADGSPQVGHVCKDGPVFWAEQIL